jgi:predicted Kef-type K+ transport protein
MMELIWISTAYIAGLVASRLTFPPLVGYLVAGYVLHGLGIAVLPDLHHLADIGIELLEGMVGHEWLAMGWGRPTISRNGR